MRLAQEVIPDPTLTGLNIAKFMTKDNAGCRAVRVGDICLLAKSKRQHVVTKHKGFSDCFKVSTGGKSWCPLSTCKKEYLVGVTEIAPAIVVGPESHGNFGGIIWVCRDHWELSIDAGSDDETCNKAALEYDATEFETNSKLGIPKGINKLSRGKGKSKAKLELFPVVTRGRKPRSVKKDTPDMFSDSETIAGGDD